MELLLTRRQTLQSLAFAAVGGASLLSLVGCGGHGEGGGGDDDDRVTTSRTRIRVELPTGFSLPLAELEGGTAFGTGALDATGFTARVNAKAPTFAYLRHKPTGKYVMFGMVGAGRPGVSPLGSATAAIALLLGVTGLPGENLAQALTLMDSDPKVQSLGQSIASALGTDPYALTNGNPAIATAMSAAVRDFQGRGRKEASDTTRGRAEETPLILVAPSDEQSGARVNQGEDGFVVPTNLRRRPAAAYTYLVGHTPGEGPNTTAPAQKIDAQDLLPTGSILGQIVSLNDRPAFGPVEGKPVRLPISGEDDRTYYETIVLMASLDNEPEPLIFGDPRYANEVAGWREKRKELNAYNAFGGVGADLFRAAGLTATSVASFASVLSIVNGIEAAGTTAAALILDRARAGGLGYVAQELMEYVAAEAPAVSTRFWTTIGLRLAGLAEAEAAAAVTASAGAAIIGIAAYVAAIVASVGAAVAVADLSVTYGDTLTSRQAVRWTETALKPTLQLDPATATIAAGGSQGFSASLIGIPERTGVTYRWRLSGSDLANLGDGQGKVGTSFDTPSNTVNLQTTPSTQGPLTVTVEALRNGSSLGKDTATVTIGSGPYVLNSFVVDDNTTVWLDGKVIFEDPTGAYSGSRGPFELTGAKSGSTLRIQVRDYYGRFAGTSEISLTRPDGSRVQLSPAFQVETPPGNRTVVLDKTFTL